MLAQRSYAAMPLAAPPSETRDRLDCLAAALDEISEGAVIMNSEGQLVWHNRAFDKLLVDNREGHLLVAAVIESASDFSQELFSSRLSPTERSVRDTTVGRIEHEIHCNLMPDGMLGDESYVFCLIKRSAGSTPRR